MLPPSVMPSRQLCDTCRHLLYLSTGWPWCPLLGGQPTRFIYYGILSATTTDVKPAAGVHIQAVLSLLSSAGTQPGFVRSGGRDTHVQAMNMLRRRSSRSSSRWNNSP